jgi:hypothetical protein
MGREEIVEGDTENILGALMPALAQFQRARAGGARPGRTVTNPQFTGSQLATQVGGGQKDSKLRAPIGLGSHTFTALGQFQFIVEPQEAFRGERLILSVVRDGAAGVDVVVNSIFVGSLPQQPSTEFGMPGSMFQPDATDAQMDWQICPAGTKLSITVSAVGGAFAEGDTLTVSLGIYGVWIRG